MINKTDTVVFTKYTNLKLVRFDKLPLTAYKINH